MEEEDVWIGFYSKSPLPNDMFEASQPNGGTGQNCGWYDDKGQVWDQPCESDKYKYYCVCKYQEVPILILRGVF